jgi:pyridoxine 5'-phosphate synthase PdxJ
MVATIPASGEVQQVGSVVRVNVNTGTILVNTGAAMARVGFTGAYADLSGAPSIPSPADAAPQPLAATAAVGTSTDYAREDHAHQRDSDVIVIPVGDESTALTTGTNQIRFRMPFAATLLAVRANVNTAPTGSTLIVDVNEAGASVLGTKLSIDASELTSTTAASAATITDSSLADDAEISIDIDQIGSTVAGAGLKVSLFVRRV